MNQLILNIFILSFSANFGAISLSHAFAGEEAPHQEDALRHQEPLLQQPLCPTGSCKVIPINPKDIQTLQEGSTQKVEEFQKNKEFQNFQQEIFQKKDPVLENKAFQQFITELNEKSLDLLVTCQSPEKMNVGNSQVHSPEGNLYIFVSFSLGEKALMNLAHEAKRYGATLVLRGFKTYSRPRGREHGEPGHGSYAKTVQALQNIILKTRQGFMIDPELFTLFAVKAIPTFILAQSLPFHSLKWPQTPLHDRMQGHVSTHYALETFAKEGELQNEAKALLTKASLSKHSHGKGKDK